MDHLEPGVLDQSTQKLTSAINSLTQMMKRLMNPAQNKHEVSESEGGISQYDSGEEYSYQSEEGEVQIGSEDQEQDLQDQQASENDNSNTFTLNASYESSDEESDSMIPGVDIEQIGDHIEEDQTIDEVREKICAVCFEDMEDGKLVFLMCDHCFHKQCLRPWVKEVATCPTCRQKLV